MSHRGFDYHKTSLCFISGLPIIINCIKKTTLYSKDKLTQIKVRTKCYSKFNFSPVAGQLLGLQEKFPIGQDPVRVISVEAWVGQPWVELVPPVGGLEPEPCSLNHTEMKKQIDNSSKNPKNPSICIIFEGRKKN